MREHVQLEDAERASRLAFLEISDRERELLSELGTVLAPHLGEIVERWYEFLLGRPETSGLLSRALVQHRLKASQLAYFQALFEAKHDRAYFEDRVRIGLVHARVGLEPPWYMGAYRKHEELVREFLDRAGFAADTTARWMGAYAKAVHLDMALAVDSYFATLYGEILAANTELRRITAELEERNEELVYQFSRAQEAARLKEELLARVSHELRTPLNAIMGYADVLVDGIDGPLNAEQAGSLGRIRHQSATLLGMIDELIDLSKGAAGMPELKRFDPRGVLERLSGPARRAAEAKGVGWEMRTPAGLPEVLGDESAFEGALRQVLENAVKFTQAGSVRLTAQAGGEVLRVSVSDTGSGIPLEHREKVFEPFHQVEAGDARGFPGLGTGLALARQGMERIGGTIRLERSGPEGSTFVLELCTAPPVTEGEPTDSGEEAAKPLWPRSAGEQARLVRSALRAGGRPRTAGELARSFRGGRVRQVENLLEILAELGLAREVGEGRFEP
jgi:signal transduction histidine kinase